MRRKRLFTTALAMAFAASLAAIPVARADFNDGVTAYEAGDYKAAFDEWLPLAKNNDPAAMRNVGHMYRRGFGVDQDFSKAMTWYKRAATIGFDRAQANVAGMYLAGEGVERDYAQAANWFARAAQQGHVVSQYNLGLLLENGLGVKKDERMALGWFALAAKAGHPGAKKKAAELAAILQNQGTETTAAPAGGPLVLAADAADADAEKTSVPKTADAPEPPVTTAEKSAAAEVPPAEDAPKGVQKKGFYEALRSLVVKQTPEEAATTATERSSEAKTDTMANAPSEATATATEAVPKEDPVQMKAAEAAPKDTPKAVETVKAEQATETTAAPKIPVTMKAATAPAPAVKPETVATAPKPTPKPAPKPKVAAAPAETVKVAAIPATPPQETAKAAASPSDAKAVPPGTGLSTAEKLEMADLAYTLKRYQQSLSIWAQLAESGNAEAQYRLGGLFNAGVAVPVDRVRAYYWWDKAKNNGSSAAATALADLEGTLTYLEKRQIERVN